MDKIKKISSVILIVSLTALTVFLLTSLIIPKSQALLEVADNKPQALQKEAIQIVSLGDSLTEGIGDSTESGGFVPLLKQNISGETNVGTIVTNNFGHAGDRSDQVLTNLQKNKEQQIEIAKADVITLTVGGNDLLKVIRNGFLKQLDLTSFEKPRERYQEKLEVLLKEIRKLNNTAPIYQLGIYNPFYLNLKEVSSLQEVVDYWNAGTEEVISKELNGYFVPINDTLYQGMDGELGIGNLEHERQEATLKESPIEDKAEKSIKRLNNLMSDVDNFHPNNLGYQLIANELTDNMMRTKSDWLLK